MRPFQTDDADALAALAADPVVMQYIGHGPETHAEVVQGVERAIRRWHEHGMSWWAVLERQTQQLIGRCCLQPVRDLSEIEVGYAFARHSWGQGLATEAVQAALRYGFERRELGSIIALIRPENLRSQRVLERCGFRLEETMTLRGRALQLYRIARNEWLGAV